MANRKRPKGIVMATLAALIASSVAAASPVEIDTPDAHIVIVRPVDRWSPDKSRSVATLELVRDRKDAFTFADANGKVYYGNLISLFGSSNKHPITAGVERELTALNATPSRMAVDFTNVKPPVTLKPEDMPTFLEAQRTLFKAMVIYYGDPATLEERASGRKFLGGLAAAGITLLSMGKLGVGAGGNFAVGSGIAGETEHLVRTYGPAAIPVPLPAMDFSGYKSIDVRRVVTGDEDRVGEIIIAYKSEKTPEAEVAAMTTAIVKTLAIGTPTEEIEAARAADLAERQAIWAACVAEGKCNNTRTN